MESIHLGKGKGTCELTSPIAEVSVHNIGNPPPSAFIFTAIAAVRLRLRRVLRDEKSRIPHQYATWSAALCVDGVVSCRSCSFRAIIKAFPMHLASIVSRALPLDLGIQICDSFFQPFLPVLVWQIVRNSLTDCWRSREIRCQGLRRPRCTITKSRVSIRYRSRSARSSNSLVLSCTYGVSPLT